MSFSVFYKFKNSKEPERILFDGTGISVFELKREIILASGLGDGSDFDLNLFPEDNLNTPYDDDTTIIPRSSTVIAVRRPAPKGHGRAARYVSGRAPVRAIKKADTSKPVIAPTAGGALSEQDAEAAFLAESAQVWDQQKESLSHAKPVFHKKKPVNVPTHEPPPGYVCYRCQKKGHWIQACPTNDDPDFKPVARAKRTTGIPRSFLKTVEKPADGDLEDARGVMLNADGEYVQVLTDTRTWEKFQEKAVASKAQAANADAANKEMEERGLLCPIDKRMYVDPVKTPCCEKTYCHDCIENALADGDLVCPNCSTEGVLIDDLVADGDMEGKIRAYEAEKAKEKADKEQQAKDEQAKAEEAKNAAASGEEKPASPVQNEEQVSVPASADEISKASDDTAQKSGSKSPKPEGSSADGAAPARQTSSDDTNTADTTTASTAGGAASESTPTPAPGATDGNDTDTSSASKKRKEPPTEIKAPTAPKAMRMQKEQHNRQSGDQSSAIEKDFIESMEALKNMPKNMPILPGAGMNNAGGPMGMSMNPMMMGPGGMNPMMGGMPGMPAGGMNPMMGGMPGMNPMMGNMGMGWNQGFNPNAGGAGYGNQGQFGPGGGMGFQNQGWNNQHMGGGYGNQGWNGPQAGAGYGSQGWNGQQHMGGGGGGYGNHGAAGAAGAGYGGGGPRFNAEQPSAQDAYERRPVNPHRAQNRNRKQRAPDFHYVGQS